MEEIKLSKEEIKKLLSVFVIGLLKKVNIKHAGNCLTMSQIVQSYLFLFDIQVTLINVKVKQGRKNINHYCLLMEDGNIIDPSASQFKNMPTVYIGEMPEEYNHQPLNNKQCKL